MRLPAAALALLLLSLPAVAHANPGAPLPEMTQADGLLDAGGHHRSQQVSFFLGLPSWWGWGFGGVPVGFGGRYFIPLVHDGFLPGVNDSLAVEVGADLSFWGYQGFSTYLDIPIEAMWSLHLVPKVSAYVKLGVAIEFRFGNSWWGNACLSNAVIAPCVVAAAGIQAQLTPAIALRLEAGYPWFKLGLGFTL